ncbi:MAG: hypothetical protein SAJ37_19780 [Oscillatoria sp. PMC 1068.18]|nr:hypothetical protein [Oscillatoria sp. PMC 1076.18]MEC4990979.1 hypothetical protein [Oscillatoria sp. PMC 1068.18]
MYIPILPSPLETTFDLIAADKNGKVVLLVEVKARKLSSEKDRELLIAHLNSYFSSGKSKVPFAMLIGSDKIEVFNFDYDLDTLELILSLETAFILSYYEPKYGEKRIFHHYLVGLVRAWLRDLAYHWKSATPPASKEIAEIGLLALLDEGTTDVGESLSGETVY